MLKKLIKKLIFKVFSKKNINLFVKLKIYIYKNILSANTPHSYPVLHQPTLFMGDGKIIANPSSNIGFKLSSDIYDSSSYIEARNEGSTISIGSKTWINCSCFIVAYKANISIGKNCRIGSNFYCMNSDFHGEKISDRGLQSAVKSADIVISDDVFIGSNVTILKGVTVGQGAIIGAGSVVTKNVNENAIVAGNPAVFIKEIEK